MTVQLAPSPRFQGVTYGGLPAVGGKLYTYIAGTSTPQATFTDSTQTTQNTNPVILDVLGEANVWLDVTKTYKLTLQDAFGNQIWSVDGIVGGFSALTPSGLGAILYPISAAEGAKGIVPTNLQYDYDDMRRYGAMGVGSDDAPAINNGLLVASSSTGTESMKIMFMRKPPVSYLINTPIVNQPGVALVYNPEDINPASTQAATLPLGIALSSVEGVSALAYKTAAAYAITMNTNNGSNPYRYWAIIGSAVIPPGVTITASSPLQDTVGVRGQATNASLNGRVWGVVAVAANFSPATSDANIGSTLAIEADVNNSTGYQYIDYDRNVNMAGIQLACGGTQNSMSAINIQVNPIVGPFSFTGNGSTTAFGPLTGITSTVASTFAVTVAGVYVAPINYSVSGTTITFTTAPANGANIIVTQGVQFIAGIVSKQMSLSKYGWYLDNVNLAPGGGVIYVSDNYLGAPAVSVKNGIVALEVRCPSGTPDFAGRITSDTASMVLVGGAGAGSGTPGLYWTNHAKTVINGFITDFGTFVHNRHADTITTVATAGVITALATQTGIVELTNATQVTNLAGGEVGGQEVLLYNLTSGSLTIVNGNSTGGVQMLLAGSANATLTRYSTITLFFDGATWIEKARSIH